MALLDVKGFLESKLGTRNWNKLEGIARPNLLNCVPCTVPFALEGHTFRTVFVERRNWPRVSTVSLTVIDHHYSDHNV
jgi:hypothetical protein